MSLNKTSGLSSQPSQQQTTLSSGISSSFGSAFQPIADTRKNQNSTITTKTVKNNEFAGFDLSDGFGATENTGNSKKSLVSPPYFNNNNKDNSGLNLSGFAGSNISDIIGNLNDDQQQEQEQHDRSIFSSLKLPTTDINNKSVKQKPHPSSAFSPPASSSSTSAHAAMASMNKQQSTSSSSLFSQRSAFVTVESLKENEDKLSTTNLSSSSISKSNTSNITNTTSSKNILSPGDDDLPKKRKSSEMVESKLFFLVFVFSFQCF